MMATFFSSFSSLILLHLLFFTTSDLLHRANAAPLDDICRQTKQPRRCISLLTAVVLGGQTASLPNLAHIALDTASYDAGQNKMNIHDLMMSTKDPNQQNLYRNCENLYLDALDAILLGPTYLQNRQYGKITETAGLIGRAVGGCAAVLRSNASLEKANEDVGIVGEAIAAIAKNLH